MLTHREPLGRAAEIMIAEEGGVPDRVPESEYLRIRAEITAFARTLPHIHPHDSPVPPRLRALCREIARRYPKPKPYAKKKAQR